MRRWLPISAGLLAALAVLVWWLTSRAEDQAVAAPRAVTPVAPRSSNTPGDSLGARAPETTATGVETFDTPLRPDDGATPAALVDAGRSRADAGDDAQARAAVEAWLTRNAALAEKTVDAFCDFSKRLAKTPGLEPPTRERDAAAFLAGRADWESGHTGLLHLPASLTDRMKQPPGAWMKFGPSDYAGLDFTWLRELLAFDHWTLMSVGPLRDGRDAPAFEQLIPNFVTMQQWAKLRLVKGLHERDLAQASVEVRHLASLCGATSTLIGEMIRLSILLFEREFFEANGLPLLDGTITPQTKQDARAAGFAAHQFLLTGVPTAVKQKASRALRCGARRWSKPPPCSRAFGPRCLGFARTSTGSRRRSPASPRCSSASPPALRSAHCRRSTPWSATGSSGCCASWSTAAASDGNSVPIHRSHALK